MIFLSLQKSRRYEHNKGFSLVELLVVVAILAILAAIAIPLFLNQKGKAQNAALTSDMHNFIMELEGTKPPPGAAYPTPATLATSINASGFKPTKPSYLQAWTDCAWDGTTLSRSNGDYVIDGYVKNSVGWGFPSNTVREAYSNKQGKIYVGDTNMTNLTNAIFNASNPCTVANGGKGSLYFYWDSGIYYTGGT